MIEWLSQLDRELFFYLNGLRADFLDPIMWYASKTITWTPVFLAIALFLYVKKGKTGLIYLVFMGASVGISDMISGLLIKPSVERYRPSRDPEIMDRVQVVNGYRGGSYGFVSSHAANTFAIAMGFFLLFPERRKTALMLFFWAVFVSYTRIYLGVHYPGDLLFGALLGMFVSYVICRFGKKWTA